MTAYIIGMVIGSIIIALGLAYGIYLKVQSRSFNKLVKTIGQKAEDKINSDIKVWSKHTNNKFMPASLFKYGEDKVFEVDSILITDKAIIVVEIKSIRGGIRGDALEEKWTKVLEETSFPISNPIIQNDKHIKHIVKMSEIKVPIVSLIVFSNRTEYINVNNIPSHVIIAREVDLFNTLDKIDQTLQHCLSIEEVGNIFKRLKSFKTNHNSDIKLHKNITTGKSGKISKFKILDKIRKPGNE